MKFGDQIVAGHGTRLTLESWNVHENELFKGE